MEEAPVGSGLPKLGCLYLARDKTKQYRKRPGAWAPTLWLHLSAEATDHPRCAEAEPSRITLTLGTLN